MAEYDFSGWVTKANIKCTDGRTIMKDAFKHFDGQVVPLVWGHQHDDPFRVLGQVLLEHRDEGLYGYCSCNDTEQGKNAKALVAHGDVKSMSIFANRLRQNGADVLHGDIIEVSLVLAGANPGARIDNVLTHSDEDEDDIIIYDTEGVLYTGQGEGISLNHTDKDEVKEDEVEDAEVTDDESIEHSDKKENEMEEKKEKSEVTEKEEKKEKTVKEVFDTLNEEQKTVVYALIGQAIEDATSDDEETENNDKSEGGNETMKHNAFDQETTQTGAVLSHADQSAIIEMAKGSNVGSLKLAMSIYAENNETLQHGFDTEALVELLPDYKNLNPGAPAMVGPDQTWVMSVINKIHKSPYSRIRTRQADRRQAELKAKGYQKKGDEKKLIDTIKLIGRTTDPQTIYVKDEMHRDDIVDTTDFDQVAYNWNIMKNAMYETLALAALVGDGRDDLDPDKIKEEHVRSIWNDEELYTIHADVDVAAMKEKLQGTNTAANFGENFIKAEAIIETALYAREKFKGTGRPDFYCDPHLVNVMLLARDISGHRMYDSKADLAKALNVGEIYEVEQLAGKTRETKEGATKKLLGLFVNLADYQFGSTRGGEVVKFDDFDIDFNKYKYLMETRLSGALVKPFAAIALEEPVVEG